MQQTVIYDNKFGSVQKGCIIKLIVGLLEGKSNVRSNNIPE